MTPRKPTADERDRAIVAKAGPWKSNHRDGYTYAGAWCRTLADDQPKVSQSAARILNRIVREEAKRGKGRR